MAILTDEINRRIKREPVMIVAPSGRVIGFTDDEPTAGQFQQTGYLAI